jgi:cytochrome c-type biogenesis protein
MGGTDIGYLAAFGGGVVSFLSPCVLPIVPACLCVVTGLDITAGGLPATNPSASGATAVADQRSQRLLAVGRDTLLFVAGFGVVFVLLGLTATSVGRALFENKEMLLRVSGGIVVAMGVLLLASLVVRVPVFSGEARFHPQVARFGPFAAPLAGAAFAFGWTPCLGPVLASILAVAASQGNLTRSVLLLVLYTLGLGVPFLVVGLAFGHLVGAMRWARRNSLWIMGASAVLMTAFGVLLLVDRLPLVTSELERGLRAIGLGRLVNLG